MRKRRPNRTSAPTPADVLFQMVIGKWISQALGTAVAIGVADQLRKGARRCSDIARDAGVSENGLYRLLRALASVGVFAESADRRFKLTPMGQLLRRDHSESMAGYALFTAHDSTWRPWGRLDYSVKTGMPAFDAVFARAIFEYLSGNPEVAAVFDAGDDVDQRQGSLRDVRRVRLQRVKTVRLAGGHGLLLATVLRRHRRCAACC